MQDTVQLQLSHGECRHDLTRRCLFFANRGKFRTGDLDGRNYEQGKLPEPALQCRAGLEYGAGR